MEVSYSVTIEDYVAFVRHTIRKSGVGRGNYLINWLVSPLLCIAGAVALLLFYDGDASLAIGLAIALSATTVVWLIGYPYAYRGTVDKRLRAYVEKMDTRGIVGRVTLIFSEESLTEITEMTRSEAKWKDMAGIEEESDNTYIMVSGALAAILPRHGFAREEEYEKARDFAFRKLGERATS